MDKQLTQLVNRMLREMSLGEITRAVFRLRDTNRGLYERLMGVLRGLKLAISPDNDAKYSMEIMCHIMAHMATPIELPIQCLMVGQRASGRATLGAILDSPMYRGAEGIAFQSSFRSLSNGLIGAKSSRICYGYRYLSDGEGNAIETSVPSYSDKEAIGQSRFQETASQDLLGSYQRFQMFTHDESYAFHGTDIGKIGNNGKRKPISSKPSVLVNDAQEASQKFTMRKPMCPPSAPQGKHSGGYYEYRIISAFDYTPCEGPPEDAPVIQHTNDWPRPRYSGALAWPPIEIDEDSDNPPRGAKADPTWTGWLGKDSDMEEVE